MVSQESPKLSLPSTCDLFASDTQLPSCSTDESERSQPGAACSWKDSLVVASPPTPSDNGGALGFDGDGRATAGRADGDAQAEATLRAKVERFYRSMAENGREEVRERRRQQGSPQAPQRPQQRRTGQQLGEQLPWPAMEEGPYPVHACPWAETAPVEAARVRSALLGATVALASTGERPYALRSVAMASLVLRAHGCGAFTTPGSRDRAVPGLAGPVVDWVLGVLASRRSGDGE
uniref:Uncharacterized protein LOC116948280 n=1 Tax=Petromyzon marinus TaxID=7757 RepID=A0AAJ7X4F1_PETMA|nr:uncharacterized protein LOC116948280 [Petromyzon marinus]XP_032820687.1 uncharacterized protein LOC116948280 [Petromyzon marinus]